MSPRVTLAVAAIAVALSVHTGLAAKFDVLRSVGGLAPHVVGLFEEPVAFQQSSRGTYYVFDRRAHAVYTVAADRSTARRVVDIGQEDGRIILPSGFDVAPDGSFVVADVPVLGSKGRTETWPRWVTANGQWLTDVEGPAVDPATYKPAKGEAIVALGGKFVVPKDTDGDGKVTGIAFDFTGPDKPAIMHALEGFGHSNDVFQFRDWTRWLVAYSQNIVVADAEDHAFYTGDQAVRCRTQGRKSTRLNSSH